MSEVLKSLMKRADDFIDYVSSEKFCAFSSIRRICDLQYDVNQYLESNPANVYDVISLKDKFVIMGEILNDMTLLETVSEILDSFERYFED